MWARERRFICLSVLRPARALHTDAALSANANPVHAVLRKFREADATQRHDLGKNGQYTHVCTPSMSRGRQRPMNNEQKSPYIQSSMVVSWERGRGALAASKSPWLNRRRLDNDYVNNEDKGVGARPPATNRIADLHLDHLYTSG